MEPFERVARARADALKNRDGYEPPTPFKNSDSIEYLIGAAVAAILAFAGFHDGNVWWSGFFGGAAAIFFVHAV